MTDAYCNKHFIGYCPELSKGCPYCEVARLKDAIREHRDSFSKDMDEHDWTTEDETLWELIGD